MTQFTCSKQWVIAWAWSCPKKAASASKRLASSDKVVWISSRTEVKLSATPLAPSSLIPILPFPSWVWIAETSRFKSMFPTLSRETVVPLVFSAQLLYLFLK